MFLKREELKSKFHEYILAGCTKVYTGGLALQNADVFDNIIFERCGKFILKFDEKSWLYLSRVYTGNLSL